MSIEEALNWATAELAKNASATVTAVLAYMVNAIPKLEGRGSWSVRN
jgi:hypothetical protein